MKLITRLPAFKFFLLTCLATMGQTVFSQPIIAQTDSTHVNKKILWTSIATEGAFYFGGMAYLQYEWYKDTKPVPFHFYNDTQGYLQVDKFGHLFGAYMESYIGYQWLRKAGVKRNKALIYGGALGLFLQTPIEVFDGLYEGWGFSWGDMAANTLGSTLVIGQELLFNEQLLKYKFSYWGSPYAKQANGYLGTSVLERLVYDYNGYTFWLSCPIQKIIPNPKIPAWLNVAAGYGANGMFGEFKNMQYYRGVRLPDTQRYRQYFLSLDIDWTKIPTHSKFLRKVLNAMVFIKLPFPTLELNSKGQVLGHWIYY